LVEICRLGCSTGNGEDDIDDINPASDYVDADNMTPEQLTCQLNEMSSTKKSKKSVSSLSDDDVRDAALTSLKALLRSQLEIHDLPARSTIHVSPVVLNSARTPTSMQQLFPVGMRGVSFHLWRTRKKNIPCQFDFFNQRIR